MNTSLYKALRHTEDRDFWRVDDHKNCNTNLRRDNNGRFMLPDPIRYSPIVAKRAPREDEYHCPIGQLWFDDSDENLFILMMIKDKKAIWRILT